MAVDQRWALFRYILIAICLSGLLLGSVKGIPRRDVTRSLDSSEVQAEQAWQAGIKAHEIALEFKSSASAAESEKQRTRARRKTNKQFENALNRYQDALDHLAKAGATPVWLLKLHTRRGDVLSVLVRHDEALAAYADALSLSPDHLPAIYGQARSELALGRTDKVRESYTRLLEAADVYGEAWAYVDWLVASMRAWASLQRMQQAGRDPSGIATFSSWVDEQAAYVSEAVRWSQLPSD